MVTERTRLTAPCSPVRADDLTNMNHRAQGNDSHMNHRAQGNDSLSGDPPAAEDVPVRNHKFSAHAPRSSSIAGGDPLARSLGECCRIHDLLCGSGQKGSLGLLLHNGCFADRRRLWAARVVACDRAIGDQFGADRVYRARVAVPLGA